jgi:hypothetical protein
LWLEVTTRGEVSLAGKDIELKTNGGQIFALKENTKVKPKPGEKSPYHKLFEALERGEKVVAVTGTMEGWEGNLTQFSKKGTPKQHVLLVQDFQTAK